MGHAARLFSPSGRVSLTENVFKGHAARAFLPSGHSASGGELFARPKSSSKTAPSGGPAGLLASLATLLELSSSAPISEGRGTLCKIWGVPAAVFEANRLLSAGGYIMPLKCQLCIAFCQLVN